MKPVIVAQRRRARFVFQKVEGGEMRQIDAVMKDKRRFQSAIRQEGAARELRQAISVFYHVNVSGVGGA